MQTSASDVLVIGSGHNGLVTACLLARRGFRVRVLERCESLGGAVRTETMFASPENPRGFRMDVGSSAHIMIHQTGLVELLELEKYGLVYIDMDPFASFPLPDGRGVIHFFKDLDRTLDSIAQVSPADVAHYRDFIAFWKRINAGVFRTFMVPPTMGSLVREIAKGQWRDGSMFKAGEHMDGLRRILGSYGQEVDEQFESPHLKTALNWLAAQSGPTPSQTATGDFVGWQAMIHESGAKHPRGGSGMLTQAMAVMLRDFGGEVLTDAPVERVLIRNGTAYGVRCADGREYLAPVIVSNAHVQTTMLKMVGADHLDAKLLHRVENINVGNGFGMVIRCAVEELPQYASCPDDPHVHNGLQLLCPDMAYMNAAIADHQAGRPPQNPAVVAMTFSKIDPDVAPDGKHTLFAWAQWHPYQLSDGSNWDDIREREAEKIYQAVERYAPNMRGKRIDWHIQSPLDIERKHGLLRGNVMHVEMSFDQMFMFRPTPELSGFRTPIKNLYLSSASCHPGGGVFGAAGFNAATVVMRDHKPPSR